MSLSSDPVFSILKDNFVCGYHDIENSHYAGASGKHKIDGNAVDTSNGAGPHNIQMFILAADGTVLHCLPGYWHSQDLAEELEFASRLNKVWEDPNLTRAEKDQQFREMQLAHISEHSKGMHDRSHMQGFDVQYEITHRLGTTDVFFDPRQVNVAAKKAPPNDVKTTDIILHERMAERPFLAYKKFDVAAYSDYGKPFYDKEEDFRDANGKVIPGAAKQEARIGNDPKAHPVETAVKKDSEHVAREGLSAFLRYGVRAMIH